jgi:MFS family permease
VPGLELREAFRSWSFWMIAIAVLMFAAADVGIRVPLIPYLTDIGYTSTNAAGLFAARFLFSAIGSFAVGYLADSFGGRLMFTAVFVTASAGIAALLGAAYFASIAMFIVVFGLVRETHLLPLVIGESLGIRRLGSLLGFLALFATIASRPDQPSQAGFSSRPDATLVTNSDKSRTSPFSVLSQRL